MLVCPNCREPGISKLRKVVFNPRLPVTCEKCGRSLVTGYAPWLATASPGPAMFIAAFFTPASVLRWALTAIGVVLMLMIPYWFLPMEKGGSEPDSENLM